MTGRFCESNRRSRGDLVGAAGLEPATTCLEGRCSIHLSYAPIQCTHVSHYIELGAFGTCDQGRVVLVSKPSCSIIVSYTPFSSALR
jgi:hypothetical protein